MSGPTIGGIPQSLVPRPNLRSPLSLPMPGAGQTMGGQGMGGQAILNQIGQLPQINSLTFLQQLIEQAMLGGAGGGGGAQGPPPVPTMPGIAGRPNQLPAGANRGGRYQMAANQLSTGRAPPMVGSNWVSPWLRGLAG